MTIKLLTSTPSDKVKAISIIRNATGLDLKESKDIIDNLEYTNQVLTDVPSTIADELRAIGIRSVVMSENNNDFEDAIDNSNDSNNAIIDSPINETITPVLDQPQDIQTTGKYTPIFAPNMISKLDRDDTLRVLIEVGKIAKESEQYDIEVAQLIASKNEVNEKIKELRNQVSTSVKIIIWSVTILATLIGLVGGPLCIVTGIGSLVIMNLTVKKSYLASHADENNANADAYAAQYLAPVETRLNEVYELRDAFYNSGKKEWAIDVIGRDLYYSACVQDIYDIIKSRRADSLKEALNKYDDSKHKERIEEMQASIQNASEIAARESVRQTAYLNNISKDAHKTAAAARQTAYYTRQIDSKTPNPYKKKR